MAASRLCLLLVAAFVSAACCQRTPSCERQIKSLEACQQQLLNDHGERNCGATREQGKLHRKSAECMRKICKLACNLRKNCPSTSLAPSPSPSPSASAYNDNPPDAKECQRPRSRFANVCNRLADMEREVGFLLKILRSTQCKHPNLTLPANTYNHNNYNNNYNANTNTNNPAQTQAVRRSRRSTRNRQQCDDMQCGNLVMGFNKWQKNADSVTPWTAAIKALVKKVTYGLNSMILIDEQVQLYPNDTQLSFTRSIRWPLNCSCAQLKANMVYIFLGHYNGRYQFELSKKSEMGMMISDPERNNFISRTITDLKEKVSLALLKASAPYRKSGVRGSKRKARNTNRNQSG